MLNISILEKNLINVFIQKNLEKIYKLLMKWECLNIGNILKASVTHLVF